MAQTYEELLERIQILEREIFGMDRETARHILRNFDQACRDSPSFALRRCTDDAVIRAEKCLGA